MIPQCESCFDLNGASTVGATMQAPVCAALPLGEPVAETRELPPEADYGLLLAGEPFPLGPAGGVVDSGQGDAPVPARRRLSCRSLESV